MEKRPVILVVMDGIGIREDKKNNAVALANKPTLDKLWAYPHSIPTTNVSLSSDVVAVFDPHPVSAKAHTMADAINFLKFIFLFLLL